MKRTTRNPIAFKPLPVAIISVLVYVGLFSGLLYVHHVVPAAPKSTERALNISEAWRDLQQLSGTHHPYNSHENDHVRNWLLNRIDEIFKSNGIPYDAQSSETSALAPNNSSEFPAVVLNDLSSNVTFTSGTGPLSVYFEGTNIIVYIRGSDDGDYDWWSKPQEKSLASDRSRGVLVNAHYDSVSTGYGATDDGVGVVTILQLIRYFTTKGNQPRRGVVALLNNGEEDYLNGAYAFTQHPISRFPNVFLNLEGAGAGGRAVLFRSTDAEVTESYGKVMYPFGSVTANDGFDHGLVKSQTDYVIFNMELGLRGLDVAFMEPRSKYHTAEDSVRNTGKDSLWHMLSAALATTIDLSARPNSDFEAEEGTDAVWFDVFGRGFGLVNLPTIFALSIILLVVTPVALIALAYILKRSDKMYLFARSSRTDPRDPHSPDEEVTVNFKGWHGFFRYPVAFVFASTAVIALAFLIMKVNPYIIYSSEYAVWSTLLSTWFVIAWSFMRGADYMRPSALHRAHAFGWMYGLFWLIMIAVTISENNFHIAGGYSIVISFAGIFLALFISYAEFAALPKKSEYVQRITRVTGRPSTERHAAERGTSSHRRSSASQTRPSSSRLRPTRDHEEATETTSLLSKTDRRRQSRGDEADEQEDDISHRLGIPYGGEQKWSGTMPSWLWLLQFLVTGPIMLILLGQEALLFTAALRQTVADGSSVSTIYIGMAVLSILLLIPVSPFLHRFSHRVPAILLCVLVGTLVYNLVAFPFSQQNRLKVFFKQELNLDSGINRASLTGLDGYTKNIISDLPSAYGQSIACSRSESRRGLSECSWDGLIPNVVPETDDLSRLSDTLELPPQKRYATWLQVEARRANRTINEGEIKISGRNTRGCKLLFNSTVTDFWVEGAADTSFSRVPQGGITEVRLWSREWNKEWKVHVNWGSGDEETAQGMRKYGHKRAGLDGRAVCLYSDVNEPGLIPAFDEVRQYMPVWSVVTKASDGLVEANKAFML